MKKLILLLAMAIICLQVTAQEDSVKTKQNKDTIHVGGIIIVKKGNGKNDSDLSVKFSGGHKKNKKSNVTTNWLILDLGFSNYTDNTNYANTGSYLVNRPGYPALDKHDFNLNAGKSANVNIWFFMQRVNLIKHYVNLKYGFGIELNNYRYKSAINYNEGGVVPYTANTLTNAPFIFRDSILFSKNKLAADYATIPLMLNFVTNPDDRKKSVKLSLGISMGYLYNLRNKQVSDERGKLKNRGDYDLEQFKFSYVGELGLGPVMFYGSYSPKSMYERSMDIRPYNLGFRFSFL
jgi:hypothetical protein